MKLRGKIAVEILLAAAAIAVLIYNFALQRETAYAASVISTGGTILYLAMDIARTNKKK